VIAIGQAAIGSKFIDPTTPATLFMQGVESLITAPSPQEAASRGTIAAAVLIISSLSAGDPNASLSFGGFLLILVENVLAPGSQVIFSRDLAAIYVLKNILAQILTEIRIEIKRRELKLPRARFEFNIFKEEKKDFIFTYLRLKKREVKILSRRIWLHH
jgi:hypothetical protein